MLSCKQFAKSFRHVMCCVTQEWDAEWEMIVKMASEDLQFVPELNCVTYQYLEQIHVFVLANVLRRPIIVYGEPFLSGFSGDSIESNEFVGVYLPLLCSAPQCWRSPVILIFYYDHFMPLLRRSDDDCSLAETVEAAVPLVKADMEMLRILFLLENEEGSTANFLIRQFLNIREVSMLEPNSRESVDVLCAQITRPGYYYEYPSSVGKNQPRSRPRGVARNSTMSDIDHLPSGVNRSRPLPFSSPPESTHGPHFSEGFFENARGRRDRSGPAKLGVLSSQQFGASTVPVVGRRAVKSSPTGSSVQFDNEGLPITSKDDLGEDCTCSICSLSKRPKIASW